MIVDNKIYERFRIDFYDQECRSNIVNRWSIELGRDLNRIDDDKDQNGPTQYFQQGRPGLTEQPMR